MLISSALAHGSGNDGSVGGNAPFVLLAAICLFILIFVINSKSRKRRRKDDGDSDSDSGVDRLRY